MADDIGGKQNKMMKMMIRKYLNGGETEIPTFEVPKEPLHKISKVLRTPDAAFDNLPDYAFEPHYFESKIHGNLRIHYIDEGRRDDGDDDDDATQETILLLHGEPTWSFLYRKMIPLFVQEGFRVVAPDLVGFGKSDKPALTTDYSYERQVDWMTELLVGIDIDRCTPFLQDWGGLIGLRVVARLPERFHRLVLSNTGLPMGGSGVGSPSQGPSKTFRLWASVISQIVPRWQDIIQSGCNTTLSEAELNAYDAPFPNEEYKAASRIYPRLVPQYDEHSSVEENKGAFRRIFQNWHRPVLTLFSNDDPVTKGGQIPWQRYCPGAKLPGITHRILNGGHFIQEDCPKEIVDAMSDFIRRFPIEKERWRDQNNLLASMSFSTPASRL